MGSSKPEPEKDPASLPNFQVAMLPGESQNEVEEESEQVTIKDFLPISWSIFLCIGDLTSDIVLACYYFNSSQFLYFWLTLSFVLAPMIVTSLFSLVWYKNDYGNSDIPKPSRMVWVIRILFSVFGMAPFLRYITAFIYGAKGYKAQSLERRKQYHTLMKNEDADFSYLRLFEAFLEAAPQVTLQLLIIINQVTLNNSFDAISVSSFETFRLVFALFSLGFAITGFNRVSRTAEGKKITPILEEAHIIHLAWHFLTICARVFALAVFAASNPIAMLFCCLAHWIFIMIWFTYQDLYQYNSTEWTWDGQFLKLVAGFVYIFTFFSLREGSTRQHYIIYYSLIFLENILMLLVCLGEYEVCTGLIILFGDIFVFTSGIGCMLIYYQFLHPTIGNPNSCDCATFSLFKKSEMKNATESVKVADVATKLI